MKKLCILLILAFPMFGTAQVNTGAIKANLNKIQQTMRKFCDSVSKEIDTANLNRYFLTQGSYERYIDQYFTNLSYNRGVLPTGNSAAVELKNNSTQLEFSLSQKVAKPNTASRILLFTEGVRAKLNSDVSQLFSGGNITTGTTFFANFAVLPAVSRRNTHIRSVQAEVDAQGNVNDLAAVLHTKRRDFVQGFCATYATEFTRKYGVILDCLEIINDSIANAHRVPCDLYSLYKRKEEMEKLLTEAGLINSKAGKISNSYKKKYTDGMYEIEAEDDSWLFAKFKWWSGGISYTRDAYDTYDEGRPLAKRFDTKNFDGWKLSLAFHWFRQYFDATEKHFLGSRYLNLSLNAGNTSNFARITNQDVVRMINRSGPDTVYTLQTVKKAKNITGKTYKTNWEYLIGGTFTGLFGNGQSTGINLRAECNVSSLSAPVYSTHMGLLLRFVNNNYDPSDKKSKAKVNIEAFIEFSDMSDVGGSGKSVWQNKVIGLGTTIPFSRIFFK
jgi:hypothetical protein